MVATINALCQLSKIFWTLYPKWLEIFMDIVLKIFGNVQKNKLTLWQLSLLGSFKVAAINYSAIHKRKTLSTLEEERGAQQS